MKTRKTYLFRKGDTVQHKGRVMTVKENCLKGNKTVRTDGPAASYPSDEVQKLSDTAAMWLLCKKNQREYESLVKIQDFIESQGLFNGGYLDLVESKGHGQYLEFLLNRRNFLIESNQGIAAVIAKKK